MGRTTRQSNPYNTAMFQEPARKQVSLRVYDNEPTVRMAEQRLQYPVWSVRWAAGPVSGARPTTSPMTCWSMKATNPALGTSSR